MTENEKLELNLEEFEYNILEIINPIWLLWEIGANHPIEINQFSKLYKYMVKSENNSVDIDVLKELGIYPVRSSMIKKLLKAGFASLSQNVFTLKQREINRDNFETYMKELNLEYAEIVKDGKNKETRLPCSHFMKIDKSLYIPIELKDISSRKIKTSSRKLAEIIFPDNILPPIIIPLAKIASITTMSANQIIYQLSKQAADNSDFFNKKIEVDKKKMSIQYPRLFDIDIQRLNKATTRDYRESYTKMVMEKMFSNNNLIKMFLNDFDSEVNSDILRIFPYTSSASYNFLQSFEIMKEIYLNQEANEKYKLTEIYGLIFDSLKYFVFESEIKIFLTKDISDLDAQYFREIMDQFSEEYIYKKNKYGISQVISFKIKNDEDEDEEIYLHFHNLNKFLNTSFERVLNKLETGILNKWEVALKNHTLELEMFERNLFVETIFNYLREHESILFQILNKQTLYRMLEGIDNLSTIPTRLKLYGKEEIDRVLGISNSSLYKKAYQNIIDNQNNFSKFIFIIFNWIARNIFNYNKKKNTKEFLNKKNEIVKEKEAIEKQKKQEISEKKDLFYSSIEITGKSELIKKCEDAWRQVPSSLSREQLEKNIYTDLLDFFKNKDSVKIYALQFIIEKNLKRIISKASHLTSYSEVIEEFIRYKTYLFVSESTNLRGRIEL
ncbi:MAG: hypothetical protein JXR63_04950 [Spirochaetales bacterium]|nr:hypothetical protein [Spirochaetales bacterium]